jgi:hypothetical protein
VRAKVACMVATGSATNLKTGEPIEGIRIAQVCTADGRDAMLLRNDAGDKRSEHQPEGDLATLLLTLVGRAT